MIKSMTGFGRCVNTNEKGKITVEVKSVNHKYLDASVKMPRVFNPFEPEIRNVLKKYASRGKVDIYITYERADRSSERVKYNKALAAEYYDKLLCLKEDLTLQGDINIALIAKSPDVLTIEEDEEDENALWSVLHPTLEGALAAFVESRGSEGEELGLNISEKLNEMDGYVAFIQERLPSIIEEFKNKLKEKVSQFIDDGKIDEGRIAAEVTIYADKIAIDEELVRLSTHIKHMRKILKQEKDIGRNLDFLAQEMNREANTILSKSNDIEVTDCGISLKTCIEKIREQVQNIE